MARLNSKDVCLRATYKRRRLIIIIIVASRLSARSLRLSASVVMLAVPRRHTNQPTLAPTRPFPSRQLAHFQALDHPQARQNGRS